MGYENLIVEEREEGLLSVELNRPKSLNALTREMFGELRDVFLDAGSQSSCRAVLLSGRGRAFCAGADVKGFASDQTSPAEAHLNYKTPAALHEMLSVMMRLPKPILAAVNGPAVGAGFPLAAAADLVVAAESAYFALGYLGIGLSPDGGWLYGVSRRCLANQRRKELRRSKLRVRLEQDPTRSEAAPLDPEASDEALAVRDALATLRPADQEILRLVAWEGMSHRQVAATLGVSPNAIAIRLHRARNRLGRILRAEGIADTREDET